MLSGKSEARLKPFLWNRLAPLKLYLWNWLAPLESFLWNWLVPLVVFISHSGSASTWDKPTRLVLCNRSFWLGSEINLEAGQTTAKSGSHRYTDGIGTFLPLLYVCNRQCNRCLSTTDELRELEARYFLPVVDYTSNFKSISATLSKTVRFISLIIVPNF